MAMTRLDAANYLTAKLQTQWADAFPGEFMADEPGVLAEIIDDALLMIGVSDTELATAVVSGSADVYGYRQVLRYAGLLHLYDAILNRVDIQMDGPQMSKSRSQFVRQMENRIRTAKDAAEPFISVSGEWGSGTIRFDYLEPVTT